MHLKLYDCDKLEQNKAILADINADPELMQALTDYITEQIASWTKYQAEELYNEPHEFEAWIRSAIEEYLRANGYITSVVPPKSYDMDMIKKELNNICSSLLY